MVDGKPINLGLWDTAGESLLVGLLTCLGQEDYDLIEASMVSSNRCLSSLLLISLSHFIRKRKVVFQPSFLTFAEQNGLLNFNITVQTHPVILAGNKLDLRDVWKVPNPLLFFAGSRHN